MTALAELDHLVLGIDDLDRGIAWWEERTGVRAALGGVHPGRGTRNALVALGPRCYLEIMAPDPRQSSVTWFTQVSTMREPKLMAWAAHTADLAALAQRAAAAGFPIDGPHDGARSRPDGLALSWKLFHLRDNRGGLLPFFIEWGRDSVHPATDAPAGCGLLHFCVRSREPGELAGVFQTLGVDVHAEPGERSCLLARITSPRGELILTS
jgi:catechol 2,3-dioxygenase-like lactoylglutathione lyase family enzyme